MERFGARRSSEKPRLEITSPRLQVIGFNVSPPTEAAPATSSSTGSSIMLSSPASSDNNELPISPSQLSSKSAASSPRSALQQLLLHQSLPPTSPTHSNHSLPPIIPFPSLGQPATSSPPAAVANNSCGSGGLLQPSISPCSANQKPTCGTCKPQSPPLACKSKSTSAQQQPELTASDYSANQSSFHTESFSSLSQSEYANSSILSGGISLFNQHNAKSAKAMVTENYVASHLQAKITYDHWKARQAKDRWIRSAPNPDHHAEKSRKSGWFHDDDDDKNDNDDNPSATDQGCFENCWKGLHQPILELSPSSGKTRKSSRSEEQSKKSSVFIMLVASSPAVPPGSHHHGLTAEHSASKTMDFLSSCNLCGCSLGEGQDVFMYSGDRAFCSMECRYQQIVTDERKERCPPPAIRSGASMVFQHSSVTAMATHLPNMMNKPYFINTAAVA